MSRITISVTSADSSIGEDTLTYEISLELTLLDLKGFVQAETGVEPSKQTFWFNGQPLTTDSMTLVQAGIKDGDMLALLVKAPGAAPAGQSRNTQSGHGHGTQATSIERLRQHLLSNTRQRSELQREYPELGSAADDPARFSEVYMSMNRERAAREAELQADMERLNDDPFNPENQQKIAEIIRKSNVEAELQETYQSNPEFFAKVTMLYVNVEVNGYPVKAFVDSGAQATIMSPSCAESCNIMRLVDDRYAGIAKGVGTAKILGRVHRATVKIGDAELPCSFTVMEGKDVDMLLGLDMLRRYQACIDLSENKLKFAGGVSVPFLPESELPRHAEEAMANEPTVAGPDGNAIGAVSGALKPQSTAQPGSSGSFQGMGQTIGSSSSSAQPAQSSAQLPTRSQAPATQQYSQQAIEQLQSMGFSREEVLAALQACDGNVEYAASLLFQQ